MPSPLRITCILAGLAALPACTPYAAGYAETFSYGPAVAPAYVAGPGYYAPGYYAPAPVYGGGAVLIERGYERRPPPPRFYDGPDRFRRPQYREDRPPPPPQFNRGGPPPPQAFNRGPTPEQIRRQQADAISRLPQPSTPPDPRDIR